jgi:hypothetical protein
VDCESIQQSTFHNPPSKQKPPGNTGRPDSLHLMQQKTRQFANERPASFVAVVVVVLVVACRM